ncbi:MAG: hypothetical protein QOJ93_2880 [Actinomycetota bacterium]|nr:hypothetical protein [Actinomycetota bacterium]
MSDDTGLLEHARGAIPRRRCGYCVDDVARGLVVVSREEDPAPEVATLGERYLAFLSQALAPDGTCHNRLGYDRRWEDEPGNGDWWGRALWGLGTAAALHRDAWVRRDALDCFEVGARCRSISPRAMGFATLGAAELLRIHPSHAGARSLIVDAVETVGRPAAPPTWPWPAPRLAYANAVLPEALIAAGVATGDDALLAGGLDLLGWLLDIETRGDHLSLTPVGGWAPGEARPGFDQQPIEAAAVADACARALAVTRDPRWSAGIDLAVGWFLGNNDSGVPMYDPETGGGFDGLSATGRNANQGAESTLALISTMQQSRKLVPAMPSTR